MIKNIHSRCKIFISAKVSISSV